MLTTFRNKKYSARRAAVLAAGVAAMLAIAGCHKKAKVAPPPPPPAATAPAPTATITAVPDTITAGQSVVLTWSTTNANSASIDGIGSVPTAGTQTVQPTQTTTYTLTATGDGGNATASATVTVNAAQASSAPTESNITEAEFEENVKPVFYPFDSYKITDAGQSVISADANYLNAHPNLKVVIGGYCDDRGSVEYNLALGENRANAAKQALVNAGVSPDRLRTVSYGKEKQFCTEQTESCWQLNRRAQFTLDQ